MNGAALSALVALQVGFGGVVIDHKPHRAIMGMHWEPSHTISSLMRFPQKVFVFQISIRPQDTFTRGEPSKFLFCEMKVNANWRPCRITWFEYCSRGPWYDDIIDRQFWGHFANPESHSMFDYGCVCASSIVEDCVKATPFCGRPLPRINDGATSCGRSTRLQQASAGYLERWKFDGNRCLGLSKCSIGRALSNLECLDSMSALSVLTSPSDNPQSYGRYSQDNSEERQDSGKYGSPIFWTKAKQNVVIFLVVCYGCGLVIGVITFLIIMRIDNEDRRHYDHCRSRDEADKDAF